jgi:TolA-binding protein
MSPEQARAEEIDHRTDLFSFGVVLYEMATGQRPFPGKTSAEVMNAIVSQAPMRPKELNPAVPGELARIIEKALEKDLRLRFQTASDLRADLQRLKRDLDAATHVPAARPASTRAWWRRPLPAAASGVVALGGGVLLAMAVPRGRPGAAVPELTSSSPVTSAIAMVPAIESPKTLAARRPGTGSPSAPAPRVSEPGPQPVVATASDIPAVGVVEKAVPPVVYSGADDLRIAREKIALKLYDPALESLHRVAGQTTNRDEAIEASFLIASIHETRGDTDRAMGAYVEVSRRFPDAPRAAEALVQLAESTLKSKRRDKQIDARRILSEVVQKYPSSAWAPRALLLRGELEEREGLYQRDDVLGGSAPAAVASYRAIVERYGTSAPAQTALYKLARIYADTKRYEIAAETFERLAERDRENTYDAWFTAGEISDKRLKNIDRAKRAYARVPATSPRYAEAQKRLRR